MRAPGTPPPPAARRPHCPRSGTTNLGRLEVILGVPAGELVEQRLEEVEDQVGVLFPALGRQVVHDNLVVLHQVLVADVDLPVLWGCRCDPHGTDRWGCPGKGMGVPTGVLPRAGGCTYGDGVHGFEVAPELLGGFYEQALDGSLLRTQVVYLEKERDMP